MKKLIYTAMLLVGFTSIGFAQEATEIAVSAGETELATSKVDGSYTFTLTNKTAEEVSEDAKYYVNYFTVDFDASSQKAKITMVENNERSRSVIMRFLVATGVRHVSVDGTVMPVHDFMTKYLH